MSRDETKRRRRWLRVSLRTFLLLTVVLSIFLAWIGNILIRVRHQRNIVTKIQSVGGNAYYGYQSGDGDYVDDTRTPPGPKIVRMMIGDDAFAYVEFVSFFSLRPEVQVTDDDLALLTEFPRLKDVSLWAALTDDGMTHIANLPKLRSLSLHGTNVTADGLARLRSANDFVVLNLDYANPEMLVALRTLPNLQQLGVARSSITSADLAHMANLSKLRQLEILECPAVGDDGMQHLANLTNLESLVLLRTSVSDDGLRHLRELRRIKSLHLQGTSVSDAGMDYLAEMSQLTELFLGHTQVGDAGLKSLAQLDALEYLDLTGSKVTDAGMTHVAKRVSSIV